MDFPTYNIMAVALQKFLEKAVFYLGIQSFYALVQEINWSFKTGSV